MGATVLNLCLWFKHILLALLAKAVLKQLFVIWPSTWTIVCRLPSIGISGVEIFEKFLLRKVGAVKLAVI